MEDQTDHLPISQELARAILHRNPAGAVEMLVGDCDVCARAAQRVLEAAGITAFDLVMMTFGGDLDA